MEKENKTEWEYLVIRNNMNGYENMKDVNQDINNCARRGWELIQSSFPAFNWGFFVFRRPKNQDEN